MPRAAAIAVTAIAALAVAAGPAAAEKEKPEPRLGRTVVVKPGSGKVTVKARGRSRFRLRRATAVPTGSTVDTTHGKVKLTSARGHERTQSGVFSGGAFVVTQQHSGLTDLKLAGGDFSVCRAAHAAGTTLSAAANRRRRLFGTAHGRFRTRGRNSSATVRGTSWTTEDRCDGTFTKNTTRNRTSKVITQSHLLRNQLLPGYTSTYFCNHDSIEPDTYCIVLLAEPAVGLIGGGIITQVDVPDYALCVGAPDGQSGCTTLPLAERRPDGFRESVWVCPVRQVGQYRFGWAVNGQPLFPVLALSLSTTGPDTHCISDPTTPTPFAKSLRAP